MTENELTFDHIHILSEDPRGTARWYVDNLDQNWKMANSERNICDVGIDVFTRVNESKNRQRNRRFLGIQFCMRVRNCE